MVSSFDAPMLLDKTLPDIRIERPLIRKKLKTYSPRKEISLVLSRVLHRRG